MKKLAICTDCQLKTTDGCGPGPVMICGHPYFKDAPAYEDAIIQWVSIEYESDLTEFYLVKNIGDIAMVNPRLNKKDFDSRLACSWECPETSRHPLTSHAMIPLHNLVQRGER